MKNAHFLSALPAFEATTRLGSFTRAAKELGLTQSALSRRILALEQGLGVALFSRRGRSLKITGDGLRLAEAARSALQLVENTRRELGGPVSGAIRVGALPSLAGLWLAPKLAGFVARFPGVTISVKTIDADFGDAPKDPVNWDPSMIDVALTWGHGGWRPLDVRVFAKEQMVPLCSPAFMQKHAIDKPEDIWLCPRLLHTTRADAWKAYADCFHFNLPAVTQASQSQIEFEHFFMIIEAARAGAGVALLPEILVRDDVRDGRLIALAPAWNTGASYAAVASSAAFSRPAVSALVDWIVAEAAI